MKVSHVNLNTTVRLLFQSKDDSYLSLTDIAKYKDPEEPNIVVRNWMRLRSTIEFLGVWEELHNPDFKPIEFEGFKK